MHKYKDSDFSLVKQFIIKPLSISILTQNSAENHAWSEHKILENQQCITKGNNSNEEHIFISNLKENTHSIACNPYRFIHLPLSSKGS